MPERPVLIAYDGSPGARAAVEAAGSLLVNRAVTVACVWTPMITSAPLVAGMPGHLAELDPELEEKARQTAEEGARLAREAGLEASAHAARGASAWSGITDAAEELDAAVIVVGARGLSPLKSALLGSVSNAVVHHTKRPVLVVHEPDAA